MADPSDVRRIEQEKLLRADLNREDNEVKFLAHLVFRPNPQRWARDPPKQGGTGDGSADKCDSNLVSHVVVLQRINAWVPGMRPEAQKLRELLLRQFMIAGLRVCRLAGTTSDETREEEHDQYFGLYALAGALVEEKRNLMTDNILSWHGGDSGASEFNNSITVSPAEKMLLTERIIKRTIEFISERRNEVRGFDGKPGLGQNLRTFLGAACCPGADCLFFHRVQLRFLVKDIFGLHCKNVRSNLVRLFAQEIRLFCCRSFKRHYFNDDGEPEEDPEKQTSHNRLRLHADLPPFIAFCDELRYHYGSETAVFFAFAAHCFRQLVWLSLSAALVSCITIGLDDAHISVLLRGIYGLAVLLVWGPVFVRLWQRSYRVLRIRWTLDAEGAQFGPVDSANQRPMQEVSTEENPNKPQFIWKYDGLLQRKVRVYVTKWRKMAQIFLLPMTWVLLLLAMCIFTLFAIWGGTYMMVLPKCEHCTEMVEAAAAGPEAFYSQDPRPLNPYDRYRFDLNSSFMKERSFDAYIFGWSDNYTGVPSLPDDKSCLPSTCAQADTYLLFGTCWDNPSGLPWEGTPLFSFIIFTAFIMRPLTAVLIMLYEMLIKCITKIENWPSLRAYNKVFLTRRFTSLWINSYWFNMTLVFAITRFGPAINQYRYQRCRGVAQDFSNGTQCAAVNTGGDNLFEVVESDFRTPAGSNASNAFIDLLMMVPGADTGSSPGVWNPENPLIAGLWIGCLFDLILTQSSFILMVLLWPGFFAAAGAKCSRSRDSCLVKCCKCSQKPDLPDRKCETVLLPTLSQAQMHGQRRVNLQKKRSNDALSTVVDVPGVEMIELGGFDEKKEDAEGIDQQVQVVGDILSDDGDVDADDRRWSFGNVSMDGDLLAVRDFRGFSAVELKRLHAMADYTKLAGVLDYPRLILLTMVVTVFTIFFPFLVIFVTGGVLLEMQANFLGLLSFSRVSIPEASGDGRWTWMILWTQQVAIPIVVSYFAFTVLEFLACDDVEIMRHIGDGTGVAMCKDAVYDTFDYDHTYYAFLWIFLTVVATAFFRTMYGMVNKVPFVLRRHMELVTVAGKNASEISMVAQSLHSKIFNTLRIIYHELDTNEVFRRTPEDGEDSDSDGDTSRLGDGEVPVYIVQAFMALLMFSSLEELETGGDDVLRKMVTACQQPRSLALGSSTSSRRRSVARRSARLVVDQYKSSNTPKSTQATRDADLLFAMAKFECDNRNSIRLAEFANGYRKFRSSSRQMQGPILQKMGSKDWDARLLACIGLFSTGKEHSNELYTSLVSPRASMNSPRRRSQRSVFLSH
eukprot:INCI12562.3.p1 GENE.INCI12562.3~~INCI12562.3.p1  ORF type:complete len:1302 (+),score=187.76 INCI12562.3:246-4151(+)